MRPALVFNCSHLLCLELSTVCFKGLVCDTAQQGLSHPCWQSYLYHRASAGELVTRLVQSPVDAWPKSACQVSAAQAQAGNFMLDAAAWLRCALTSVPHPTMAIS